MIASARYSHAASVLASGKVLVAGGRGFGDSPLNSAEVYDPVAGTWSATGSLASAHHGHTASMLASGKVLVVAGGYGPNHDTDIGSSAELYDPVAGVWSSAGYGTECRDHTDSVLSNGDVLIVGGRYTENFTNYVLNKRDALQFVVARQRVTLANECESGFCVDSVCCTTACGGEHRERLPSL